MQNMFHLTVNFTKEFVIIQYYEGLKIPKLLLLGFYTIKRESMTGREKFQNVNFAIIKEC
ncbi:unnamed protein product (macronuclear) [Paramecium tetraurelia]|uniref:Uncharacterized protein n=1 Tax=Paramecium tetraurelia TaxID=5888 RepID=A0DY40_PARTE|nr:uncharacterized protein GSPATT00039839001 [Paramecium tetraurelia]CAK87957.1 unnamed protein product [Paramecium tetraurelia]|eukprot:XP_001455354.1 hypothetical protein (macronuclear) [Paramecium tetraurelia strain d4-2]